MHLSDDQQLLQGILEKHGIATARLRDEWGAEYMAVPIPADDKGHTVRHAVFHLIEDGRPLLTALPQGRYITVTISRFYSWWESLTRFPQVLEEAAGIAYAAACRDVYVDFCPSPANDETMLFTLYAPLTAKEALRDAVLSVYQELTAMIRAAYAYVKHYDETYEETDG